MCKGARRLKKYNNCSALHYKHIKDGLNIDAIVRV
jgi:hypothetical protein